MRRSSLAVFWLGIFVLMAGAAFGTEDIAGKWKLQGSGFAEKGVLRVELRDEGSLNILVDSTDGVRRITGYDLYVVLNASRLGINAWERRDKIVLDSPVRLPDTDLNGDFELQLPPVTIDGLTYKVRFTSKVSGIIDIYGTVDIDTVGRVGINSESAIWKDGTPQPDIADKSSGCNSGGFSLATLILFAGFCLGRRKSVN